jgi:hypothetical protein
MSASTRMMGWAVAALPLLAGCSSSAPFTVPAAAINTVAGLGAAAEQRAAGGCYAVCTNGTQCNPNTGFCERSPCGECATGEQCIIAGGGFRCSAGATAGETSATVQTRAPPGATILPGLGVTFQGSGPPPVPGERPEKP